MACLAITACASSGTSTPGTAPVAAEAQRVIAAEDLRPRRESAMVDFNPSEFSRIRLQYSRSRTLPGAADNEWFVQYILSLGAHGAHRY